MPKFTTKSEKLLLQKVECPGKIPTDDAYGAERDCGALVSANATVCRRCGTRDSRPDGFG